MRLVISFQPENDLDFPAAQAAFSAWLAEHGRGSPVADERLLSAADGRKIRKITMGHNDLLTALHSLHTALDLLGVTFEVRVSKKIIAGEL